MLVKFFIMLVGMTGLVACNEALQETPDPYDEIAFVDGKADNAFNTCGIETLLTILETEEELAEHLRENHIHTRAARNIAKKRNGSDGIFRTSDDFHFKTMQEVDKVPYVGRVAMRQLSEFVADATCTFRANAEVIFSPQLYGESHLAKVAELIEGAEESIDIAMYSHRDRSITNALERAVQRGINVRYIFEGANKDQRKPAKSTSAKLEIAGIDVRYINKIMHHKFILIDGPQNVLGSSATTDKGILSTGSANWSTSAGTRYDENTVFIYGNSELNFRFQREFNHLWGNSRDFSDTQSFTFFETDTIEDAMITEDSNIDAIFSSDNFRAYVSSRYGNTFSGIAGKNTIADRLVEYINGAQHSIRIASGHLRSRPVAEALLAKVAANPNLDVKVYLDAQEYVSSYTHQKELKKRKACLLKATSVSKKQKCLDKGFHYAFDIKEAGIPTRFKTYSYRWHYSYAVQMHHKYLIIDNDIVIAGSYNLSDNAEHNTMENMVIYQRAGFAHIVDAYTANFEKIWTTGNGKLQSLLDEIRTKNTIPIVFESMALDWNDVRRLKRAISVACPIVNSTEYRKTPERHFTCKK